MQPSYFSSLPTLAPGLRLGALPGHVPEALAVVALDTVLALGLVALLGALVTFKLLVLVVVAEALTTVPEAPEAALAAPVASIGPSLLLSLLLLLPQQLDLLFLFLIPS